MTFQPEDFPSEDYIASLSKQLRRSATLPSSFNLQDLWEQASAGITSPSDNSELARFQLLCANRALVGYFSLLAVEYMITDESLAPFGLLNQERDSKEPLLSFQPSPNSPPQGSGYLFGTSLARTFRQALRQVIEDFSSKGEHQRQTAIALASTVRLALDNAILGDSTHSPRQLMRLSGPDLAGNVIEKLSNPILLTGRAVGRFLAVVPPVVGDQVVGNAEERAGEFAAVARRSLALLTSPMVYQHPEVGFGLFRSLVPVGRDSQLDYDPSQFEAVGRGTKLRLKIAGNVASRDISIEFLPKVPWSGTPRALNDRVRLQRTSVPHEGCPLRIPFATDEVSSETTTAAIKLWLFRGADIARFSPLYLFDHFKPIEPVATSDWRVPHGPEALRDLHSHLTKDSLVSL